MIWLLGVADVVVAPVQRQAAVSSRSRHSREQTGAAGDDDGERLERAGRDVSARRPTAVKAGCPPAWHCF